jgi:hypothetical protein
MRQNIEYETKKCLSAKRKHCQLENLFLKESIADLVVHEQYEQRFLGHEYIFQ